MHCMVANRQSSDIQHVVGYGWKDGVPVLHLFDQPSRLVRGTFTIKPLDDEAILNSIKKTRCVVTCEEHNYLGGLGESVSGLLAKNDPVYQEFVATNDTFGESGTPAQLMEKYGLNTKSIVEAVNRVLAKK